ncbi:hypothetical protein CPB86DRAFT_792866 [Serendipita vermifera]|nr:hypothetical protein CPB86DRAFT_792866 [Serendipita vermifera]
MYPILPVLMVGQSTFVSLALVSRGVLGFGKALLVSETEFQAFDKAFEDKTDTESKPTPTIIRKGSSVILYPFDQTKGKEKEWVPESTNANNSSRIPVRVIPCITAATATFGLAQSEKLEGGRRACQSISKPRHTTSWRRSGQPRNRENKTHKAVRNGPNF